MDKKADKPSDNSKEHLAPSLGGEVARQPANDEPSLSFSHLLPGLREALGSDDRGERVTTIEQIVSSGTANVIPLLVQMLQEVANPKTRQRCAAMLGQLGDDRAVKALVDLLDDADTGLRKVTIWALGQIRSEEAVEPLLALIEHESDTRVAGAAILSLGWIGDPSALPALFHLIDSDSDAPLVDAAFAAIKAIGQTCSLTQLMVMLCSDNKAIRDWAADRFIHNTETPLPENLPLLEKLLFSQERTRVRQKAIHLLAALENEQARSIVLQVLMHPDADLRLAALHAVRDHHIQEACDILLSRCSEETDHNRRAAIEAIGVLDDPRVIPFLLDVVEERDDAWTATEALQSRGDVNVPQLLLERLRNATGEARSRILFVLGNFNTSEVVTVLLDIAHNSADEGERHMAVFSIRLAEYPEATSDLIDILYHDPSVIVRRQAIRTLSRNFNGQVETTLRNYLSETDNDELRACALSALLSEEIPDGSSLLLEQIGLIKDEEALAGIVHHFHTLEDKIDFSIRERLYRTAHTDSLRAEIIGEMTHCSDHASAVRLVIDALKNDSSAGIRSSAINTLYYLYERTDRRIVEALIEALSDTAQFECRQCEEGHRVCDTVAIYLERIDSPEAAAALAAWRSTQEPGSEIAGR